MRAGLAVIAATLFALSACVTKEPGKAPPEPVALCKALPSEQAAAKSGLSTPPTAAPLTGHVTLVLTTIEGLIEIDIDRAKTPCTAAFLGHLAGQAFYDDTSCHRMTNEGIWVLQCGDPAGTGEGGPGFSYAEEDVAIGSFTYKRGTVAMAKTQAPNSTGSQFFFSFKDNELPHDYTPFGTVTNGMDIVDKIVAGGTKDGSSDGKPARTLVIQTVRIK